MADTRDTYTMEDTLGVSPTPCTDAVGVFPSDFSIDGYEELRTIKVALQRHTKRGSTIASLLAHPIYDLVHAYQAYSLMQTQNEHWAKTRHAALEYLNITHCFLDSVTTRAKSGRSSLSAAPANPIEAQLVACGCFGQEVALKGAMGKSATREEYHAKALAKELSIWKDRMQREQKASKNQNKYIFNEFMYDHHESHVISLDRLRAAGFTVEVPTRPTPSTWLLGRRVRICGGV